MSTIRVGRRKKFTTIDRRTINDERLSLRAKGLLVWILDKPDDWRADSTQIAREVKEGRDAVRAAMRELAMAGYLERTKVRDDRGHWSTESVVHERPPKTDFQASASQASEDQAPETDFQASGDQAPETRAPENQALFLLSTVNEDCHSRTASGGAGESTPPVDAFRTIQRALIDATLHPGARTDLDLAKVRKATKSLVAAGATVDQVDDAVRRYRDLWPNAPLTALGLAGNWNLLQLAPDELIAAAELPEPAQRFDPDCDCHGGWIFNTAGEVEPCQCTAPKEA